MADEYKRINLLIGTQADLAAGQEEGMPGIVSDNAYRLGWYANGAWKLAAMRGTSESFADVTLTNGTASALLRFDANKKAVPGLLRDDGTTCYHPTQFFQWTSERTQSCQFTKTTSTTVTGTTVETSVINGGVAAGGWNAITVPAGRLNIAGLLSDLKLKGVASSEPNTLTLITWRLKINGSTVAIQSVTRSWGSSFWRIEGGGTTRSTGTTGARQWDIGLYANADSANSATSYYDLSRLDTINLETASTIDVTVQFSLSTTSVTCSTATLRHS